MYQELSIDHFLGKKRSRQANYKDTVDSHLHGQLIFFFTKVPKYLKGERSILTINSDRSEYSHGNKNEPQLLFYTTHKHNLK